MQRIVLASKSPRRHQLLAQMGIQDFEILVTDTDESYDPALSPQEIVSGICRKKAEAAARELSDPQALIIAADTMVFLDGLRLGKPRDEEDAFRMLRALSGREHLVCTGMALIRGERVECQSETTSVRFGELTDREIRAYIATGDPMDKAGAYGIQGPAALFVSGICGDYSNVMGLPIYHLGQMLRDFGIQLLGGSEQ